MFSRLPAEIDPLRLADEGRSIEGDLPAGLFHRLAGLAGDVRVSLHFERMAHGARRMHGCIEASVVTPCQRCLEPVDLKLSVEPDVLLESGDYGSFEDCATDVLPVKGLLRLADFVEDELLLAMPMMPVHTEPACELPRADFSRGQVRK